MTQAKFSNTLVGKYKVNLLSSLLEQKAVICMRHKMDIQTLYLTILMKFRCSN